MPQDQKKKDLDLRKALSLPTEKEGPVAMYGTLVDSDEEKNKDLGSFLSFGESPPSRALDLKKLRVEKAVGKEPARPPSLDLEGKLDETSLASKKLFLDKFSETAANALDLITREDFRGGVGRVLELMQMSIVCLCEMSDYTLAEKKEKVAGLLKHLTEDIHKDLDEVEKLRRMGKEEIEKIVEEIQAKIRKIG